MSALLTRRALTLILPVLLMSCTHMSEPDRAQSHQNDPREILLVYSDGARVLFEGTDGVGPQNSRFAVYSLAKPMTAAASLRLMEKGKLRPDSNIRDFLPEFPVRETPVTLLHLATHQSGIRHYNDDEAVTECGNMEDALERFRDDDLVATPGTDVNYSSHGFIALSAAIARINESSFDAAMEELVFVPLSIAPELAKEPLSNAPGLTCKFGAGGYLATADEVAQFVLGLFNDEFLSSRSQQMFLRGSDVYRASGQGPGGTAYFWIRPEDQSAVILLSDASDIEAREKLSKRLESEIKKLTSNN